jgi:DNA replication protein DnaC
MDSINKIIVGISKGLTGFGIKRISYLPYKMDIALSVVERIGKRIDAGFTMTPDIESVYKKLIQYFHADSEFDGDLTRGILLMGPTGSGKTLAMKIMSVYRQIDDTKFILNDKIYRMNYDIVEVNKMISDFTDNAYDGIKAYTTRYVLCMDDIGTEVEIVKYFGNNLDVASYIIAERYAKRLLTFGTTNLPIRSLEDKYDDRITSRMFSMFNFITMKGEDYRRISNQSKNEKSK